MSPQVDEIFSLTVLALSYMAGFAGERRPHPPDGRTGMPAARRYPPIVSRRMCTAASIRRSDHPSRPSAITCSLLSLLKALLTLTEGIPPPGSMSRIRLPIGRFSGDYRWPVLGDSRGSEQRTHTDQAAISLREPLFLSHLGSRVGSWGHQAERTSSLPCPNYSQRT